MVNYTFYKNTFKGFKTSQVVFENYINRAQRLLEARIGKLDSSDNKVKLTLCEIVDALNDMDKPISERVGSHSVSYGKDTGMSVIDDIITENFPSSRKFRGVMYVY